MEFLFLLLLAPMIYLMLVSNKDHNKLQKQLENDEKAKEKIIQEIVKNWNKSFNDHNKFYPTHTEKTFRQVSKKRNG